MARRYMSKTCVSCWNRFGGLFSLIIGILGGMMMPIGAVVMIAGCSTGCMTAGPILLILGAFTLFMATAVYCGMYLFAFDESDRDNFERDNEHKKVNLGKGVRKRMRDYVVKHEEADMAKQKAKEEAEIEKAKEKLEKDRQKEEMKKEMKDEKNKRIRSSKDDLRSSKDDLRGSRDNLSSVGGYVNTNPAGIDDTPEPGKLERASSRTSVISIESNV